MSTLGFDYDQAIQEEQPQPEPPLIDDDERDRQEVRDSLIIPYQPG